MIHPVTVIVPCRNERLNIRLCIESFHEFADEVLIADSLSTDETVSIAKEFPKVRVVQREYRTSGDFKNWAIPQAKNQWVLLLDADERVTPALAGEIDQVLSGEPDQDGYWIYRDNHFMGKPLRFGDARTDKVIRLFKRDVSRYEGPSDHGEVNVSTGRVGILNARLLHYTVWTYDQYFTKFDRYTRVQSEQWFAAGRDTSYFKLLVRPAWRFFREYILQGGILDGKAGLQLSWLAAFYSFTKQGRLWQLNHGLPQPDVETEAQTEVSGHDLAGDITVCDSDNTITGKKGDRADAA
jgi:glycosyltransferase involved in cell wall biosynthesis